MDMTPELMQDNMSTIKLAEKGKSTSDRTTKEISDLHMSSPIASGFTFLC